MPIVFVEIFLPLFSKWEKCCRTTLIFSVPKHVLWNIFLKRSASCWCSKILETTERNVTGLSFTYLAAGPFWNTAHYLASFPGIGDHFRTNNSVIMAAVIWVTSQMLLKTRRVVVNAARSVQSVAADAADYTMTDNGAYGLLKIKKSLPKDFQADTCI